MLAVNRPRVLGTGPEPDGDSEAVAASYPDWESVYQDNVVGLYQLAFRRVGNAADAEDIAQEVLINTLKTLRLPAPVPTVRAYLVKTARSVLADHWRRHYAARDMATELVQLPVGTVSNPNSAEMAQRLLSLLPQNFRTILELRFLRGYSAREIATELGTSESNVRVLQFRALRKAAQLEREVLR